MVVQLDDLICIGCNKTPEQLSCYTDPARAENMTNAEYVWSEEGTLNRANGHFLCDACYIAAGMPTAAGGWKAP